MDPTDKLKSFIDGVTGGKSRYFWMIFTIGLCLIAMTATVVFLSKLKDIATTFFYSSMPDEGIPTQVQASGNNVDPTTAFDVTSPPEGTWLVTPEEGATCNSNMAPNITSPFNVTVAYDGGATTLVITHPDGVIVVDQEGTSPTVKYRGGDTIAEYELEYMADGTMSITETFTMGGNPCVVLSGSMEYQGDG